MESLNLVTAGRLTPQAAFESFRSMTKAAIRQLVRSSAKCPVILRMNNGRSVRIAHPDFVMFPATEAQEFVVSQPSQPYRFEIIDMTQVTSAEVDRKG